MTSKIFRKLDGSYTLNEFDDSVQNKSVVPMKYSPLDSNLIQRVEILKEKLNQ